MDLRPQRDLHKLQLNEEFRQLITLVCEGIGEFRHYDPRRIAVSVSHSRTRSRFGVWAHVIPLRYVGGKPERKGRRFGILGSYAYESPRLTERFPEANYLMTFMVPRFFALSSLERLETVVHELYHVHPSLRGDLRRFSPPHIHHGPTPALFNRKVKSLAQEALREIPRLMDHPLLTSDGTRFDGHKRIRWPRPRRVFKPSRWLPFLLLPLALLWATWAGAVDVLTTRKGDMFAEPSTRSQKVGNYLPEMRFKGLRLSSQKTWIEIQNGTQHGWIPRSSVRAVETAEPAPSLGIGEPSAAPIPVSGVGLGLSGPDASPADADPEIMDDKTEAAVEAQELVQFDALSDKYFATDSGRLFEQPSNMAARFGTVEKEDELQILSKSKDGQWSRVRLVLTGEEGWFPAKWMRRQQEERIRATKQNSAEGGISWGSRGHNFGFEFGYHRRVASKLFDSRPRDHIEAGVLLGNFFGETLKNGTKEASVWYLVGSLSGRYVGYSSDGRFAGALEMGLNFQKSFLSLTGFTDDGVKESMQRQGVGSFLGMLLGIHGSYAFTPVWSVNMGARFHVATKPFGWLYCTAGYRF